MKIRNITFAVLFAIMLASIFVLPAQAAKPTVNNTFYFGAVPVATPIDGEKTLTEDGTIIHNKGITTVYGMFYRTPEMTAAQNIGHIHIETNFDFVIAETKTAKYVYKEQEYSVDYYVGKGLAVSKMTIIFGENSQGAPVDSPFGKGTMEAISFAKVTSTFSTTSWLPSDGKGYLVAARGTGDFEKAMLISDFATFPMISPLLGRIVRITVGFDGSTMPVGAFPPTGIGSGILIQYK